jgi:hypothetical protein
VYEKPPEQNSTEQTALGLLQLSVQKGEVFRTGKASTSQMQSAPNANVAGNTARNIAV